MSVIFASDFSGILPFLLGVPLLLAGLMIVSFYAAVLGHWLTPVLAIPTLAIGLLFAVSFIHESARVPAIFWVVFLAPLVLGIASLAVWSVKRATPIAIATSLVVAFLVLAVLGWAGIKHIHHEALAAIEATERAKLKQLDTAYQAKLSAAIAADPANADKIRAELQPEADEVEKQRQIVRQAQDDLQ